MRKFKLLAVGLILSLLFVQATAMCEEGKVAKKSTFVEWFRNLLHYPADVTDKTSEVVTDSAQKTVDTAADTVNTTTDVVTGDIQKTPEIITTPVQGVADVVTSTTEGVINAPIDAAAGLREEKK